MTYSLVARDAGTGELGVAVQTCVAGVGAICPWARAGVGAVATQARAEPGYGPRLLELLAAGEPAREALASLRAQDPLAELRQVGAVDAGGETACFTGTDTIAFAGDVQAEGLSCQANMMARPGVPEAMRDAFQAATGPLSRRLLAALRAAEDAGGDLRGSQSAAMLVVEALPAAEPWQGVVCDLRVDDHAAPLDELARLLDVREAYRLGREAERLAAAGERRAALPLVERSAALAPHDQNVLLRSAVFRLLDGDAGPLRELLARRPAMRTFLDWLVARGEVPLSPEPLALLD